MTQDQTPSLRFPEFRGAWEMKQMGEIATFKKGKGIAKSDIAKDGINFCIRYGELFTQYGEIINTVKSRTHWDIKRAILSEDNDVLMPTSDVTPTGLAKACALSQKDIILGGDILIIRSEQMFNNFFAYYVSANKQEILRRVSGVTVYHIYASDISSMKISLPPLAEQKKIAACLSSLDEVITVQGDRLDRLKDYKRGLMQQLFPADGQTTPTLRFPEFQGKAPWEVKPLGEICDLQDGYAFSPKNFTNSAIDAIQVIRITDINNKNKNADKVYVPTSLVKILKLDKYMVQEGDLLLSLTGAAGFNFFLWNSNPVLINQRTMKIMAKEKLNTAMLKLLEPLIHTEINSHGTGQNNNVSKETLKHTLSFLPKPAEQQKIAECLSSLDELITAQEQKIKTLKHHKNGLMQQLFPEL